MNPLGWKSAIFNLGRSVDSPMGEVADDVLQRVRLAGAGDTAAPSAAATLVGDDLITGLGSSREIYDDVLRSARSGADDATVTHGFEHLAGTLRTTEQVRLDGAAAGHVRGARQAAEEVVEHLRRGAGPDHEPTHMAIWNLRYHLNEGWNALGTAKVLGELRGITSVT